MRPAVTDSRALFYFLKSPHKMQSAELHTTQVRAFFGYGVIDVGKERKKTDVTLPESVPEGLLRVNRIHPQDRVAALAGNPNVGKSTVFNALTGLRQHTGYCKYG